MTVGVSDKGAKQQEVLGRVKSMFWVIFYDKVDNVVGARVVGGLFCC